MNMIEKILAMHSGQKVARPGDIITCKADWAAVSDFTFAAEENFFNLNKLYDPSHLIIVMDHKVPACTAGDAGHAVKIREFAKRLNVEHFFDVGRNGISHQIIAEKGFAAPGKLIACSDSHTCAAGALNCCARGLGAMEMLYVVCKGETWYSVGPTIRYNIEGKLPSLVSGKDVFLYLANRYGDIANRNIEFNGSGITNLSIADRQCIATMCAEISAEFVIFPCDRLLLDYLKDRAIGGFEPVESDPDALYEDIRTICLDQMVPYITLPHYVPNNCKPVTELAGMKIDQAFVGSCANGRIEDIAVAAELLSGKTIHPDVRLIVTPASQSVFREAVLLGYVGTLIDAGALVTNPTCGACIGEHMGLIGAGERCISSSARNFKGRMGDPDSEVLLASPATVAASALRGAVTDPRYINV